MGITHYWKIKRAIDPHAFANIVADVKKAIPYLEVEIAGGDGTGEPEITERLIRFNGQKPHDYETFAFYRLAQPPHYSKIDGGWWFSFCKVGFSEPQPYDIAVKVVLVIAKHHCGNAIVVNSDESDAEWEDAIELVENVFGYGDFAFGQTGNPPSPTRKFPAQQYMNKQQLIEFFAGIKTKSKITKERLMHDIEKISELPEGNYILLYKEGAWLDRVLDGRKVRALYTTEYRHYEGYYDYRFSIFSAENFYMPPQ